MTQYILTRLTLFLNLALIICISCTSNKDQVQIDGIQKKWEKITLSFEGPALNEESDTNPFLDYRLQVNFHQGNHQITVPGFYAADGNSAETSASSGNIWQVRFRPDRVGTWEFTVSFRAGKNISISDDPAAGTPVYFDGQQGTLEITENPGHPGRLIMTDKHYLKYADTTAYFIKGGADSPENFLAYYEFDGTYRGSAQNREGEAAIDTQLHHYDPHLSDWNQGDPIWQNDKGKAMIGALNYLAGNGMNSVYFLTMNIEGDGKDVWPYTGYEERVRFDCSKLDQWEIVFDHMDQLGLMLHMVTQETENEKLLDNGDTDLQRKLYYRELIARFGHHLGVTWNLGEENGPMNFSPNGQSIPQRKAMAEYFKTHDPYQNFVAIHTHHNNESKEELFTPMLGFPYLDGISLQNGNPHHTHATTLYWRNQSAQAGHPWVVNMDELGPANRGIDPDDREDNNQDEMRAAVLWANLMAGGGGVEWYFGYRNHDNDLGCEDWRSRDRLWDYTRHALHFFQNHLPFTEMSSQDQLLVYKGTGYCFAKPEAVYMVYVPEASEINLDLRDIEGNFIVKWFNPRQGGSLMNGSVRSVSGGTIVDLGQPPANPEKDWSILVSR